MSLLPNTLRIRRLLVVVIALLVVASVGIAVGATLLKGVAPKGQSAHAEERAGDDKDTKPPAHMLVLRPGGFEPAEVSWPKGRFFLAINNQSSFNELNLQVDREVGGRVKEFTLKSRKQRGAGIFDLPPGEYLLREANHPDWVCRITITPQ